MSHISIPLKHCHGSENYFMLIDGLSQELALEEKDYAYFTKAIVKKLKNYKIDGVLFLLPSDKADARMRIFNKDGSEAEMCGNGFRCIGRKVYEITGKESFKIETMKAILEGRKETELFPNMQSYSVLIPNVSFDYQGRIYDKEIIKRLDPELKFCSVNVGNPQLITHVTEFKETRLFAIGEWINKKRCKLFPEGNNISFYQKMNETELFVLTYERGVGMTNSCGTAMAATTLIAAKNNIIPFKKWISVYNRGGLVQCYADKTANNYSVKLLGNATYVKDYIIEYDPETDQVKTPKTLQIYYSEVFDYIDFRTEVETTFKNKHK